MPRSLLIGTVSALLSAPLLAHAKDVSFSVLAGSDGAAALAFEQAADAATSFEVRTAAGNPETLTVRTESGRDLLTLCGAHCGKAADDEAAVDAEIEDIEANAGKVAEKGEDASAKNARFVQVEEEERGALRVQRRLGGGRQRRAQAAAHAVARQQQQQQQRQHRLAQSAQVDLSMKQRSDEGGAELLSAPNGALSNKGGSISMSGGGTLSVGGQEQWRMVVEESFPVGGVTKWVDGEDNPVEITASSTCARNADDASDHFLGAFGHAKVTKTFPGLPGHTHVRVTARAHFLDMWVGDLLYLKADGKVRWTKSHRFCTSTPEKSCQPGSLMTGALDACLDPNFSDTLSVPIDVEWSHSGTDLELAFRGHLTDGTKCASAADCKDSGIDCDMQLGVCVNQKARWGVDDVRIYVR